MNSRFLVAGFILCAAFSTSAEAKLFKWVDDQGVTHYSSTIPPEYANKDRVQINKQGREVKPDEPKKVDDSGKPTPEEQAAIDQRRRDKALLDTYSNENEIDLARNRNLQQVDARINGIKIRLQSAQANLEGHLKERDRFTKSDKKIPTYLRNDLKDDQHHVDRLQEEMNRAQKDAAAIKARYDADKVRYRELTGTAPAKSE
jgi:hypothetical protein